MKHYCYCLHLELRSCLASSSVGGILSWVGVGVSQCKISFDSSLKHQWPSGLVMWTRTFFWKLRYSPSTRVIQTWIRFFHITTQDPHFKRLFYWTQISGQSLYRRESSKGVFTVHRPRAFHAREGWLEKGGIVLLFGFVYLHLFVCTLSHLHFCCLAT